MQQAGPPTRRAAAAARQHLLEQAAAKLDATIDSLQVVDGEIHNASGSTGLSYWQLIGDEQHELDFADDQSLKSVDDYTIVGESYERIDIPNKVFGGQSYLQDLRLPDMVHARIVRPPTERAELKALYSSGA